MSQLHHPLVSNQNRVSQSSELVVLRARELEVQRLIDQNAHDMESALTAPDATQRHYSGQVPVTEKSRAKLRPSEELIGSSKQMAPSLKTELQQLRGLLHPIRRYPDDHMQLIFEECVKDSKNPFITASCLSHVCRRWRHLALSTPQLWKVVGFKNGSRYETTHKFKTVHRRLKSKAEAFVSRVGTVPTEITIQINVNHIEHPPSVITAIKKIPFDVIFSTPVISILVFIISHVAVDPAPVLDVIDHFPCRDVEQLSIRTRSHETEVVHPGPFISKFSGIRILNLMGGRFSLPLSPPVSQMLTNIHEIDFEGVNDVPIMQMLRLMHGTIQSLSLRNECRLELSSDENSMCYVMPKLSSLCVDHSPGFPWSRIQCPNLMHLDVPFMWDYLQGDPFWGFFSAANFIKSVYIHSGRGETFGQFARLARDMPHLHRLHVQSATDSDMALISTGWQKTGLEKPPFPALVHLKLSCPKYDLQAETLDAFIQSRCLSREHPASTMDAGVANGLEEFEIIVGPWQPKWGKSLYLSMYFKSAKGSLSPAAMSSRISFFEGSTCVR